MTCRRVSLFVLLLVGAWLAAPPAAAAQNASQDEPPKNLQVLPKDMTRRQVVERMRTFTQGLGVDCQFCHVDDEPGRDNDFASDEKDTKKTARVMMRMVDDLNAKLATSLGKPAAEVTSVQCATCHRGVKDPRQLYEVLTQTSRDKGVPAAITQFRDLRRQYYGGQSYDFSENGLVLLAQQTLAANRPDEALTWLKVNLEFYPNSARTYVAMAQAYSRKQDRAAAVASAEKALTLDPKSGAAKRMLEQLRKS